MKHTLLGLVIVLLCVGCALEGDHFLPTYTIVYHPNGGTGSMEESTHVFGTKKQLNANKFTRQGFAFTGWSLTANRSVVYRDKANVKNLTKTDGETVVLYAKWKLKHEMVKISAGTFTMGSNDSQDWSASPPHPVTLTGFRMGKYPITQEQYQAVMGTNPSYFTTPVSGETNTANRPVEQVTWYNVLVFCNKLSMVEGLKPVYRIDNSTDPAHWQTVPTIWLTVQIVEGSNGYRLPTEAEWEYACRTETGTTTAWYTGSSVTASQANFNSTLNRTTKVGSYAPNAWGLYDMIGNVAEWCWDWYGAYSAEAQTNPTGAVSGSHRIHRGGSWYHDSGALRSACRNQFEADKENYGLGFRVVRPE